MFKEFSLGCSEVGSAFIHKKKKKQSRNSYSLSLDVTRCITHLSFYELLIESALPEFKVYWKAEARITKKPNQ